MPTLDQDQLPTQEDQRAAVPSRRRLLRSLAGAAAGLFALSTLAGCGGEEDDEEEDDD